MVYVYILKSEKSGRLYIGSSEDVEARINRHNQGIVSATKNFCPWKLMFKQEFQNLTIARAVESKLKRYKRKDFLEKIIKDGVIRKI